jgi:putative membrane protein
MERRLLTAIMTPAMVATWIFGLWLAGSGGWYASGWLQVKVVLAVALSALHGFFARWARDFAADRNRHSQRFYRIVNELPTVIMIAMVILAVLKPF